VFEFGMLRVVWIGHDDEEVLESGFTAHIFGWSATGTVDEAWICESWINRHERPGCDEFQRKPRESCIFINEKSAVRELNTPFLAPSVLGGQLWPGRVLQNVRNIDLNKAVSRRMPV